MRKHPIGLFVPLALATCRGNPNPTTPPAPPPLTTEESFVPQIAEGGLT